MLKFHNQLTLISLWICPCRWRYSKAFKVSFSTEPIAASSNPSGYAIFMRCKQEPSAMNGMTTQRFRSTTNEQYALTTLGWSIKLIVWASLRMSSCKTTQSSRSNPPFRTIYSWPETEPTNFRQITLFKVKWRGNQVRLEIIERTIRRYEKVQVQEFICMCVNYWSLWGLNQRNICNYFERFFWSSCDSFHLFLLHVFLSCLHRYYFRYCLHRPWTNTSFFPYPRHLHKGLFHVSNLSFHFWLHSLMNCSGAA